MRVVAGACLLLLLLVDLPAIPARKIDNLPEEPPEPAPGTGYEFITSTISSLSTLFGLDTADDNAAAAAKEDSGEREAVEIAVSDPEAPPETSPGDPNPKPAETETADEAGFSEEGIQADEAPKEDGRNKADKERSKPKPGKKEDGKEDKKEDGKEGKKEDGKEDKATSKPDAETLEEKLNAISEKEDKILKELDKAASERDSPRRRNSSGLMLVNGGRPTRGPSGVSPNTPGVVLGKPLFRPASSNNNNINNINNSVALMSDRHFQPAGSSVNDLALYMRTCDSCLVTWDSFQCPMNDLAIELKKWVTELEELLSFGCQLEGCDGSRKCCHSRDPVFERALNDMTNMARQMYNTFQSACSNCPRDGGWTEWCEWGACSVTCGPGTRTRSRQCSNPAPKGGGRQCVGLARETLPCSNPSCCTPQHGNWGPWTPWAPCSVTCGMGSRDRQRQCSSPPPNQCGRPCPGPDRENDICREGDCCVHGNWGFWGSWTPCSASCGSGMRERQRRCDSPSPNHCGRSCPGSPSTSEICNTNLPCQPVCEDGNWGPWQPWSGCSATCGSGSKNRMRRCDNPPPNFCGRRCSGPASDMQPCSSNRECCVNGNWGSWEPWSQCSASCDRGSRERRRRCSSPPPNYCGMACPGPDSDRDSCDERPCPFICVPREGDWSPWSYWSSCSSSCGPGTRDRSRTCSNPPPNSCGRSCPGPVRDSQRCEERSCCLDGNWGNWGPWSVPSVTCGTAVRNRQRRCDSPSPNYCGTPCPGPDRETDNYDTNIPCRPVCEDGNWGNWGPWSVPSGSCGMAVRDRQRRCDSPRPNYCGRPCPGPDRDTDNYNTNVPCVPVCIPLDGNWSQWSPWSPCSATCGEGTNDRFHTCTNPSPNRCGRSCPGPDRDTQRCNQGSCCIPQDGNWSPWTSWSPCPVTCGSGSIERTRSCSNPPPNRCGRSCPGPARDSDRCDRGSCCIPQDGNWSPWTSWSPCPVSCGTGSIERTRSCSNPPPNRCGRSCPGPARDSDRCDRGSCCIPQDGNWSPWTSWSPCPVTCGTGSIERTRSCSNPPPNRCGRSCPGPARDSDRCNPGPCCVDRTWEPWGPWSQPGVTCGTASRERRRRCGFAVGGSDCGRPCPGPDFDRESYDTGIPCITCIDGNWSPWSFWGPCSVTCGSGTQDRERTCSNPPANSCGRSCMGPPKDMKRCNEGSCCIPQNGNWSPWTRWSPCSATCGSGVRERSRQCSDPPPNECGQRCPGSPRDTDVCDGGDCCVNGNWGPWGSWSSPLVTCGTYVAERRRRCDSPAPNFCGRDCPGPASDNQVTNTGVPCEVCTDGNWGQWEPWSQCTVTCGMGPRERRRRCDSPAPSRCGRSCPGPAFETGLQRCGPDLEAGNWSPWGPWGSCSRTCGRGQQTRRRRCDVGPCGSRCPGFDSDTQSCNEQPCCVPREWTPWTPWSVCDSTCGRGRRTRQRTCRSVGFGDDCGSRCPGRGDEVDECRGLPPCEVPWGPWSSCSATCEGFGVRERRRLSNVNYGDLVGRQTETERCQIFTPPCPQPAQWTSWNEWCPCDCKKGVRARRRACEQSGSFGRGSPVDISNCDGAAREEEYCDVRQACPACVDDCTGRQNGDYPACTSCSDYLTCSSGRASMLSCGGANNYQYDAFIRKCVPPPSPSCTLVECITSCFGLTDGTYPSCSSCQAYIQCRNGREGQLSCPPGQEFNAHSGQCQSGRSPTCVRAIRRTLEFMYRDAPADSFFPADKLSEEERKALYFELREKAGIAAQFNRSDEDVFAEAEERKKAEEEKKKAEEERKKKEEKEEKEAEEEKKEEAKREREEEGEEEEEEEKKAASVVIEEEADRGEHKGKKEKKKHLHHQKPEITIAFKAGKFPCQRDCTNVTKGQYYQSCRGCHYYLVCTKHGIPHHKKCPRHKSWDDVKKKCRRHSDTCKDLNSTKP